jgi:hypothetical protein
VDGPQLHRVVESEEPYAPLNIVATLDRQGLSVADWPPPGEPCRGLLGCKGAPACGAALGPVASGVGEVACPIVMPIA